MFLVFNYFDDDKKFFVVDIVSGFYFGYFFLNSKRTGVFCRYIFGLDKF